jgi:predicted RNA-binding protein with PUA-like domain
MRAMRRGDHAFFYHSNADPPAIVGVIEVVREAYADPTAFDPTDKHYDPQSVPEHPRWDMVDIRWVRKFERPLSLDQLRREAGLQDMELLRRGSRLSVQPVRPAEWTIILKLADRARAAGN